MRKAGGVVESCASAGRVWEVSWAGQVGLDFRRLRAWPGRSDLTAGQLRALLALDPPCPTPPTPPEGRSR